jgi:hypothetical protein
MSFTLHAKEHGSHRHVTQTGDLFKQKSKQWGKKAPGIVAKDLTKLKTKAAGLGICLVAAAEGLGFESQLQIWEPILLSKFQQNAEARAVLQSTWPNTLAEMGRFPSVKQNYWSAFIKKAGPEVVELIGENMMGRLLQHVRDTHFAAVPTSEARHSSLGAQVEERASPHGTPRPARGLT